MLLCASGALADQVLLTNPINQVNGREVNTAVVRTQIWVMNGMKSDLTLTLKSGTWNSGMYVSLQDPWISTTLACDGTQTPTTKNTYAVDTSGKVTVDFDQAGSKLVTSKPKEYYLCLSSTALPASEQALNTATVKNYFTIDTLVSVWVVPEDYSQTAVLTKEELPCVCTAPGAGGCPVGFNNIDCSAIKLYGPVAPPTPANIQILGGVMKDWQPPNAVYGTTGGFAFGIPTGTWYMPVQVQLTNYATRGPFAPTYASNGGWTISFVGAPNAGSYCGLPKGITGAASLGQALSGVTQPDWISGLNWIADNRTSVTFGTTTATVREGTIGWVRISDKVTSATSASPNVLCVGISATGATPKYLSGTGNTYEHHFFSVGSANDRYYRVAIANPTLSRFGGANNVAGAIQKFFSPTSTIEYAVDHVNVEVAFSGANDVVNSDTSTVSGTTVLVSLQKGQCGSSDLKGISTPTFVEVRNSATIGSGKDGKQTTYWERDAFSRLYSMQLSESWIDLNVCYAVVPVWYHRFNRFSQVSFYGTSGLALNPTPSTASGNQFFFPTPDNAITLETAQPAVFKSAGSLTFTIIPTDRAPQVLTFGNRRGDTCNAVGLTDEDRFSTIPVTLSCDITTERVGTHLVNELVDIVIGLAVDDTCRPYTDYSTTDNGRYSVQRVPMRIACSASKCTWGALATCGYTKWSTTTLQTAGADACQPGQLSFGAVDPPYLDLATLAPVGTTRAPIETLEGGRLCVAVVPKMSTTTASWHDSGFDLNDMRQAAQHHRKLVMHMVPRSQWALNAVNNVDRIAGGTTGAVSTKTHRVPVQISFNSFTSTTNCPLNAFQISLCYVQATGLTGVATTGVCDRLGSATSTDCGYVTACDEDLTSTTYNGQTSLYGWASITPQGAGEAAVCAQISSSYGEGASVSVDTTGLWTRSTSWSTTPWAPKSLFTTTLATSNLFFIATPPTILSIGGRDPTTDGLIFVPHEDGRQQYIPIVVDDVSKLMPVAKTNFAMTNALTGISAVRNVSPLRIRAIDLVVMLTTASSCQGSDLIHYSSTTNVNTYVAYTASKDWSTTFTTMTSDAEKNYAQLKFVRPAYQGTTDPRAAHGPQSIYARVCYSWIPAGWTSTKYAQDLTGAAPTMATCTQAIMKPYITFTETKLFYEQVKAPDRIGWIRENCGTIGGEEPNTPVFLYNYNIVTSKDEEVSNALRNATVYISHGQCDGGLTPFNMLTAVPTPTYSNQQSELTGLQATLSTYISIEANTYAYPAKLVWEGGRFWYRNLTHHYVATYTCAVFAPSWLENSPAASTAAVWSNLFTNAALLPRQYGVDGENVFAFRLGAVDFDTTKTTVRFSSRVFQHRSGASLIAARFKAVPSTGIPQVFTFGGVTFNGAATSINVPSFGGIVDSADKKTVLYSGTPQFLVTLEGISEITPITNVDLAIQLIRDNEFCGNIDSSYLSSEQDYITGPGCCNSNITRYNFAKLSQTSSGLVFSMNLMKDFELYNNETNAANKTRCYKACQAVVSCGEIPVKKHFKATNFQVCIVPERNVRSQVAQLPSTVIFQKRTEVAFVDPAPISGLCPFISLQDSSAAISVSTGDSTSPIPLKNDARGWYFSLSSMPAAFWTNLRAKSSQKFIPQIVFDHCGSPYTSGYPDTTAFTFTSKLRTSLGVPTPSQINVFAPKCDELTTYLTTSLPPATTADCDSYKNKRMCPTIVSMFGKDVTGPRKTSLSETCNAFSTSGTINVATVVGTGKHKIPVAGYKLDAVSAWVSVQPVDSNSRPCDGQRAITGVSAPVKIEMYQDCTNKTQVTDVWGVQYQVCPQQNGYFTLNIDSIPAAPGYVEYAVCVAYVEYGYTPIAADFNDRLDVFNRQLAVESSPQFCDASTPATCAQPIGLHIIAITRAFAPTIKCLGGCSNADGTAKDSKVAYTPMNTKSRLPIEVVRPWDGTTTLPKSVQPDIWVVLEPSDGTRGCRGYDILNSVGKCANGNQLHVRSAQTTYYPIKVSQGFSRYNPGESTNAFFQTNYSMLIDAFHASKPGKFNLCYYVGTNGVPPEPAFFSYANGVNAGTTTGCSSTPCTGSSSCTLEFVYQARLTTTQTNINKCASKPRGFVWGLSPKLDTFISLQSDPTCRDPRAFVRGADESYVRVQRTAINERYYYSLPKRLSTASGLTICAAQMGCGSLPEPGDFWPVEAPKIDVIEPTTLSFPSAGLTTYTCDGSKPQSGCTDKNVGFYPCTVAPTDTSNTCVYAAAGCPIKRCSVDGVCASSPIPIQLFNAAKSSALYEGCNITIRSTNYFQGGYPNVTASIVDGYLSQTSFFQYYGETCNSFRFDVDCGCSANPTAVVPSFGVKTQVATNFYAAQWPECVFFPMGNAGQSQFVVGFNVTLEREVPVLINVTDQNNVTMYGDMISTASMTAVISSCALTNSKTNPSCTASPCVSIQNGVRTLGMNGGPYGFFNFSGAVVSPVGTPSACDIRLLITYSMTSCNGTINTFYSLSPVIRASTVTESPCRGTRMQNTYVDGYLPQEAVLGDNSFATPAPVATLMPGSTATPPTAAPTAAQVYSQGAKISMRDIPTSFVARLGTNEITNIDVVPGRHAVNCPTTLNITMFLTSPVLRKNDGSNTAPELVIRFPMSGNQLGSQCNITHAAGAVNVISHKGFNVAPASASWAPEYCQLTLRFGCSQITGQIAFEVSDFTFLRTGDPGIYPLFLIRDRDTTDPMSPANVLLMKTDFNPPSDEIGNFIDSFDAYVRDDTCDGIASLELCFKTTNEVQIGGMIKFEFVGSDHFTYSGSNVRVELTRVGGVKAAFNEVSNSTAVWVPRGASDRATLSVFNRGTQCWAYGHMCLKVYGLNVPTSAANIARPYCISTYAPPPQNTNAVDVMLGDTCQDAISDDVNVINDLRVTSAQRTKGDLDFPLTFSFTMSKPLDALECITIDVPYFQNNNVRASKLDVPLITGYDDARLTDIGSSRYYDVVGTHTYTRSEGHANPSRFLQATFVNKDCGGTLQLCTSCPIGNMPRNGTGAGYCTKMTFTVDNFYAPSSTFATCTQPAYKPYAFNGRLTDWKISTPRLQGRFDMEQVFTPAHVLGGAALTVTHTYNAPDGSTFPFFRYAREAHATHLTLFFTLKPSHSIMKDDVISIQFPCDEGKRYAAEATPVFQNSPLAYCKATQACFHSCLTAPAWDKTTNTLTVKAACPFEAGSILPFALAPFTAPLLPGENSTFKFNVKVTRGVDVIDSGNDLTPLTHHIEGISNFTMKSSSCVPGGKTTVSVSLKVSRVIKGGAIVIVFPDNTWHPSYSALVRSNDGVRLLASGNEGLIPLITTNGDYDVYWRNQTFGWWGNPSWSSPDHISELGSNRNAFGDREQALFIFPAKNQKFSSNTISVDIQGLINPWKRSWSSESFGGLTTNEASPNPSGAYRGNWQFKRVEYRSDSFNVDGTPRAGTVQQSVPPTSQPAEVSNIADILRDSGSSWYLGNSNYFIHLPLLRTHDWYFATGVSSRSTRISGNSHLSVLYIQAPAPYWASIGPSVPASKLVYLNYPDLDFAQYADEKAASKILLPEATTGIRDFNVVPSNRKLGASNVYLDISFKTCNSMGRSGRIDISFGVQQARDLQLLPGAQKDADGNSALLEKVTQYQGTPFLNRDGPVSVELISGEVASTVLEGYFRRSVKAIGNHYYGGILSITGFPDYECSTGLEKTWSFRVGAQFGGFYSLPSQYPITPGLAPILTAECLDPGLYQVVTYTHGCRIPPGSCPGACGTATDRVVEVSSYFDPTDDWLNDDYMWANVEWVEPITADQQVGYRLPCAMDNTLKFTAVFRKRVTEGDTIVFQFPTAAEQTFTHSPDATVNAETVNATYRAILSKSATWDNNQRTLTVTFARSPSTGTCASNLIAGGECIVAVVFTIDGWKNPAKSGKLPNMTATLNLQNSRQTQTISTNFQWLTIEKLQFTTTLLTPTVNSLSDVLFEFPSVPCYIMSGNKYKIRFPTALTLQSDASLTVLMPNLEGVSRMTAQVDGQTLVLSIPSESTNRALCAINNAKKLVKLQGAGRQCSSYATQTDCVKAGCISNCATAGFQCMDGYTSRYMFDSFVNDTQTNRKLTAGFRVLVQKLVMTPPVPGDPGAYDFQITESDDVVIVHSTDVNPTNENTEENTDLIQGIDNFDIKPASCTWSTAREDRSVALELSFINYGTKRGAAPGSELQDGNAWNSPYNQFRIGSAFPFANYIDGTQYNSWFTGKMHQIEVCFPEAEYSYTWMGANPKILTSTYSPLNRYGTSQQCTMPYDVNDSNAIPLVFKAAPAKFNTSNSALNTWTTSVPITSSWFSTTAATDVTRCAMTEGHLVSRKNRMFAQWLPDKRCVRIETYEDLVNGKYTFILGEETNMNGFTQGHPLPNDAMSGKDVSKLGPQSGIVRDKSDGKKYIVALKDRYDDTRDLSTFFDTLDAKFDNGQCMAPITIHSKEFVPPSDAVRSGIADFDVVPSKSSPGGKDVWLTFSMTVDVAMSYSSGMDIIFPPASFHRGPMAKCDHRVDNIEVEVLSHTTFAMESGAKKTIQSPLRASARWIFKASDYKNIQAPGGVPTRDYFAGVLRMNFTRIDRPGDSIDPGYIVFRVGGFVNPARIGDPSRPMTGPWKRTAEEWSGDKWYNNARTTDWKVEVFEYSFGDKNQRLLSTAGSTEADQQCGDISAGSRHAVYARGSMNAPSDYIGSLYCGPEGIKIGDTIRRYPFDVVPSRNSIHSATAEEDLSLTFSMCVRRDIPEGSRIVIRLPQDSFQVRTCDHKLYISSADKNAPGLVGPNTSVFVDRPSTYNVYRNSADPFGTSYSYPKTQPNPTAAADYGYNRYEEGLTPRELSDKDGELTQGYGSYPTNTNGALQDTTAVGDALQPNARTITVIVGPGGVLAPERPKYYDTSATNTLTASTNDRLGQRGPTGVRLFTFTVTGFIAPCSVNSHINALGTYDSQDLATGDPGEYDVRIEFGSNSLLDMRNSRIEPCTDKSVATMRAFTMQGNGYSEQNGNSGLWQLLISDNSEVLHPSVEVLPNAKLLPDILETKNTRASNFYLSYSNPPSDSIAGIVNDFNFNFELKIISAENDHKCGTKGLNVAGAGDVNVSKYAPGTNNRLQFSLELPSCFVSRSALLQREAATGIKRNEYDGDKLVIRFPGNSYNHKCGRVDLSNVPGHNEDYYYHDKTKSPEESTKVNPWAVTDVKLAAASKIRITRGNNDMELINTPTPLVELLSAEWTADARELTIYGPLADWRISKPKQADTCTQSRRHVIKFEACCFQLPTSYDDPGNYALKYFKRSRRDESMIELLSQGQTNPTCDAVPNPASCESMWGGCGVNMKECTTGTGSSARCICIPKYATCCNASHGFGNIPDRQKGLFKASDKDSGVRGYCDDNLETCERFSFSEGSRCSMESYMPPRTRGLSIALPLILFAAIFVSLVIVVYYAKDQLAAIIAPLVLGVLICAFSAACLLSREWYTAFGFAALAIFNIFAAHPPSNSRYMVVCLLIEGLMLLSFFSTGKVLPTRTAQTLIPVYDAGANGVEASCIAYYGYYSVDYMLLHDRVESPQVFGRHLCSRSWLITLDILFVFIIACFTIIWFVNLYFLGRQRECESRERRERRSHCHSKDATVRMLVAENNLGGEVLPPVEEVAFNEHA